MAPVDIPLAVAACLIALAVGAGAVHGLYRLAEFLKRLRVFPNRDFVMVPGLLGFLLALAPILDGLKAHAPRLFGPVAISVLLGMRGGQILPRPPRAGPPRQ